jgi:hypothetical protein
LATGRLYGWLVAHEIDSDLGSLYGPPFASLNAAQPASILLAEGSFVSVSDGRRLSS